MTDLNGPLGPFVVTTMVPQKIVPKPPMQRHAWSQSNFSTSPLAIAIRIAIAG